MKNFFKKHKLQFKVLFVFIIMVLLVLSVFYPLMPKMLNYPEGTYGNDFQWELEHANYTMQFIEITSAIFLIYAILVFWKLSFLNHFDIALETNDIDALVKIRKKLFKVPDELYMLQTLLPSLMVPALYAFTTGFFGITTLKVFILYASFITVISTFSTVFVRREFAKLLAKINVPLSNFEKKSSLTTRMYYQITPLIVIALMLTSLIGYSALINAEAPIAFDLYKTKLNETFGTTALTSTDELYEKLQNIELSSSEDLPFVLYPDGTYHNIQGEQIEFSDFWNKYLNEFSKKDNSMIYDYYGFDIRGAMIQVTVGGENYIVGIQYDLTSYPALLALGAGIIFLFILNLITLFVSSHSLADEVQAVSNGMKHIVEKVSYNDNLPITSNDEIGDLVVSFNEVQDLTKSYIEEIQNGQNMLIERERLASLGQMIGGIAHNLKTPIMSIAGAAEGLTELVAEYVASIDNPIVTKEDHKEIAKDMLEWIQKVKTHTSYMSDIITTVKGQAAQLSTSDNETFTVYDLSKRVDILMKHELKRALVQLNTNLECSPTLKLQGDINNLIQVINNLITNSIQAYEGKPNQEIDFTIRADEKNIYFEVADKGCGMSKEVKEKLFKEMYTTKGKNGTGLGLYMSYSTIKGKFNGDIHFVSEVGKGTTFTVTIPLPKI
ncbi:MAG: HAMP domain-containing histidine kinase [Clostridia bacterium]|nr:HAMP domain-containing histidine kinase [Clostridia bacterium]